MRKSTTVQLLSVAVILLAIPLLMGADPAEEPGGTTNEVVMPDQPLQRTTTASLLMEEINAAMAAGGELLAALNLQLKSAPSETEALRLLDAIHQQKQETEITILRIQERHARLAGDTEAADKINLAVDDILNPPVRIPDPQARAESEARRSGGSHHE